jgi:CPA2 family monovalent cation:H+ antiporter-2
LLAGLSVGLGAFLAGLAIAESGYIHHTLSEVAPIRDLLISVFFISIGMLLDITGVTQGLWLSILLLAAVIVIKFASGFIPTLIWGYPLRIATIVGAAMAQLGEFAFIVGHTGYLAGLIRDDLYAKFLLVGVVSMIVNPFLISGSSRLAQALTRVPGLRRFDQRRMAKAGDEEFTLTDHVIIAGYGLNGRNLATALQTFELPFAVLEMNPNTVHAARLRGEPVFFGDCSRVEILRKMGIDVARGLILAISDPQATRQAVQVARNENPDLHIIVRTRYMSEIDLLRGLGASEVIAEEFETSLEVLTLALRLFDIAETAVDRIIEDLRSNAYQALRGQLPSAQRERLLKALVPQFDFETHQLTEDAPAVGKTLRDLDLRAKTGATLLAVRRTEGLTSVPPPDFQFQKGDLLVLAGNGPQLAAAVRLITGDHDERSPAPAHHEG